MSFLNSLLLTLIKALHTFINNYALTIIVFTILIKLVVMPLNLKSRRSTMRMSTIQPKAAALQAKYKDDQEKLNQKLQELYRKEGINPMGSCLPMLISMVILFAMFYALRTFANERLGSQFLTSTTIRRLTRTRWSSRSCGSRTSGCPTARLRPTCRMCSPSVWWITRSGTT